MHAPGLPALSTGALAARVHARSATTAASTRARRQRAALSPSAYYPRSRLQYYSSSSSPVTPSSPPTDQPSPGPGSGTNGKPNSESVSEQDQDNELFHTGQDTHGGRLRKHESSSSRSRHNRRRTASALPPVTLPPSFESKNISYFKHDGQPELPLALIEDENHEKVSRLYNYVKEGSPSSNKSIETLESYFDAALNLLLKREKQLALDFLDRPLDGSSSWDYPRAIAQHVRVWDMIIDSAWHLTDALYPARQPEYIYKTRPFWWWHFYKDLDPRTQKFRGLHNDPELSQRLQISFAEDLDCPLPHSIADFPPETFDAMAKAIDRELSTPAPASFDSKTGKRPIHIISTSGYGGKAISRSIGSHIGWFGWADVIHLDAYDISSLIGEYLGQDWAFSRGSLSTLGFRAAELNGKIPKEPESSSGAHDDDDGDNDTSIINVRTSTNSLEDELQKVRQGSYDVFSKWENLKIDKMVDHIIRSTESSFKSSTSQRKVLVHVHDYVELSMTLEGSMLLSRLRTLVDAAWQQGKQIAILGTSSCKQPSEDYQNTIRELSTGDLVVTRHIQPDRAEKQTGIRTIQSPIPYNLERMDTFEENASNINRMLCALDPKFINSPWEPLGDNGQLHAMAPVPGPKNILRQSVLPIPDVYFLASAVREAEQLHEGAGAVNCLDRFFMGPLRQPPGQDFLEEQHSENVPEQRDSKSPEDKKFESRSSAKLSGLNEYEKRIASGLINRENLRTAFDDVHAPPDTISALKLLTSLALVRPDAFSYGVLAHDKITGCLLYGPPGTGKTMLAKAVAKESGANMLEISGASINDKWVGEAEKLIRAVFTLAKKLSPCVVFIDEADAMLANRSMFSNRPSHREHINQFLKEWDGMEETNAFIMVATNRPFDLDDAVLRRLPRKILVDLPLKDDRAAILHLLLKDERLDPAVSLEEYATNTPYYSGSDLKNVCVAAAMAAVEEENTAAAEHTGPEPYEYPDRRTLHKEHFDRALKQIPASISEDMPSLRMIRRFDEEYGNRKKTGGRKGMGFGHAPVETKVDAQAARVRQSGGM